MIEWYLSIGILLAAGFVYGDLYLDEHNAGLSLKETILHALFIIAFYPVLVLLLVKIIYLIWRAKK